MMPNRPTLLRQCADRPPTLSQQIIALIRGECGREQISMTALAAISGLSYHKVRNTLRDKRPLFVGDLAYMTDSLGLDIADLCRIASENTSANVK
jgi:hypothetical protein